MIGTGAADFFIISSVSSGSPVSDLILAPFEDVITMYVASATNLALMVNRNVSNPDRCQITPEWVGGGSNKINHIATKFSPPADTMSRNHHGQEDISGKKVNGDSQTQTGQRKKVCVFEKNRRATNYTKKDFIHLKNDDMSS